MLLFSLVTQAHPTMFYIYTSSVINLVVYVSLVGVWPCTLVQGQEGEESKTSEMSKGVEEIVV